MFIQYHSSDISKSCLLLNHLSSVLLLIIVSTSWTESGKAEPLVSGSSTPASPPSIAAPPNIQNGRELFFPPSPAIKGARNPPIL